MSGCRVPNCEVEIVYSKQNLFVKGGTLQCKRLSSVLFRVKVTQSVLSNLVLIFVRSDTPVDLDEVAGIGCAPESGSSLVWLQQYAGQTEFA